MGQGDSGSVFLMHGNRHKLSHKRDPAYASTTRLSTCARGVLACALLAALLAGPLSQVAQAEPMWTTYHRDTQRSGYDPDGTQPIEPVLAWQSVDLKASIWSQPLVLGERVYVATEGDKVYALEASTGKVVWEKSVGTPVPASKLLCGDIEPTVGVVGTPVIDPSTQAIYFVADTWNAGTEKAQHVLKGLSLIDGKQVLSTVVDPPGSDPTLLLQRTALNLDAGKILFGFGGNDGDCGEYFGTVATVPEKEGEGPPTFWQYAPAPPGGGGGAVWATSGPAVDGKGTIYASTGNPNPPTGQEAITVDRSDNVVQLDLEHSFVADPSTKASTPLGFFAPPTWKYDSNHDVDLGSAGPELLPEGLLFQAGKNGTGYVIDETKMSSGETAVFEAQVCKGAMSFGGDAFANNVIYLPCTNGVQALSYSPQARTFAPLWQAQPDAVGPPIVSAGLVWSVATGGSEGGGTKLYGLDPLTGKARYTETLPSPVVDHFASPSAAGGRLFVSTGSSVTAYQVAKLTPVEQPPPKEPPEEPSKEPPKEPSKESSKAGAPNGSGGLGHLTPSTPQPQTSAGSTAPLLLRTHLHASPKGNVRVALRCTTASKLCRGTIMLQARFVLAATRGTHRSSRTVLIELTQAHFGPAKRAFGLTLHLDRSAIARLHRHKGRLALQVTISSPGAPTRQVTASLT